MTNYILPVLIFSTVFERLNIFLPALDFSLKLSLILLPVIGLILLLKKKLTFNPTFLFPFLVAVLGVEVLSIFFSYNPFQSLQVVIFHLLMVGLFYLIIWSNREERQLNWLVWAWGIAAAAVSLLGFWQFTRYLFGADPTLFFEHWFLAKTLPVDTFLQSFYGLLSWGTRWDLGLPEAVLRPPSTFIDVSTGASFVGVFLVLGLSRFFSFKRNDLRRGLMGALLVFSAIYFLLALSRSAAFGLVAGLAVFSYLVLKDQIRVWVKPLILAISAAVILVGVLFTTTSLERLHSAIKRLDYAQAAVQMVKKNPLLGVGAGNFENYYREVTKPGAPAGYSHSILLTWLGELGILGFVANLSFAGVLIYFLYRLFDRLKRENPWRWWIAGLSSAYVALLAANVFHAHYGLEFTWVLLGLCVSALYLAKTTNDEPLTSLDILGIKVDNVTMGEAIERIKGFFKSSRKAYVVTPNPEMVILARKDKEFTQILNQADLAIPDGIGLVWASRIWGTPLREHVAGADLFLRLCEESARRGGQVFLLGGPPGVAERAARKLQQIFPKIRIAGTFAGDGSPAGDAETVAALNRTIGKSNNRIDLLFVAYGHGKQERWIKRNLPRIPVKVAMVVGGTLDFIAGEQLRAPKLVRGVGLEWLYRLLRQPWRIKRQLALVPFIFLTFKESFRRV